MHGEPNGPKKCAFGASFDIWSKISLRNCISVKQKETEKEFVAKTIYEINPSVKQNDFLSSLRMGHKEKELKKKNFSELFLLFPHTLIHYVAEKSN